MFAGFSVRRSGPRAQQVAAEGFRELPRAIVDEVYDADRPDPHVDYLAAEAGLSVTSLAIPGKRSTSGEVRTEVVEDC
jgi:hypothetical protein